MTTGVQIDIERLSLRKITTDDSDLVVNLFCDPHTMDSSRGELTTEETREWIAPTLGPILRT